MLLCSEPGCEHTAQLYKITIRRPSLSSRHPAPTTTLTRAFCATHAAQFSETVQTPGGQVSYAVAST